MVHSAHPNLPLDISLEELWLRLNSPLKNFICRRVPGCDDADDILQDVFLRIHANLDRVREIDRLEAWVYQIARNSVVDFYRTRRITTPLVEIPVDDEMGEVDTAVELADYLREIVEHLPDPYRQALILTDYEGLSQVELAQRLNISVSGAKSRVQRARQKVKDVMLACCHFEFDARGIVYDFRERCCCCEPE